MRRLVCLALLSALCLAPGLAQAQHRAVPAIRVTVAPPPLRNEVAPVAPSPRHHWIGGYWGWRGKEHVWIGGHWALPPAGNYVWEPARWESAEGAYMFYDGHWRATEVAAPVVAYQPPAPPVQETIVETAPPVALEEVRSAMPFEGAVWIPGYWHWNGFRHTWVGGRWSSRPAGHSWEPARWDKLPDGRYVHRPGHWHAR